MRVQTFLFIFISFTGLCPAFAVRPELCFSLFSSTRNIVSPADPLAGFDELIQKKYLQEAAWVALEEGRTEVSRQLENEIRLQLETAPILNAPTFIRKGSSESYVYELEGGLSAVFKPRIDSWKYRRVRRFHNARMPEREVATYLTDQMIEAHLTSVTIYRVIDGVTGSFQVFVHVDSTPKQDLIYRTSRRLKILDYLAGVWDRYPNNEMHVNGGTVAHDHALAFLNEAPHRSDGIAPPPHWNDIELLVENDPEVIKTFRLPSDEKMRSELGPHLLANEIDAAIIRLENLRQLFERSARRP